MNANEFDIWFRDFCAAFPETPAWVNKSPDPKATQAHWLSALATASLAHAKEATRLVVSGKERIDWPGETPAMIRSICIRLRASESNEPSALNRGREWAHKAKAEGKPTWSMADVLIRLRTARENGESLSVEEAIAESSPD